MPTYTVLSGTHRREDGSVAEVGDTVELSEDQRESFSVEKFEPVEEPDAESIEFAADADDASDSEVESAIEAADSESDSSDDADVEMPTASDELPDDWEMLQAMAVVYDGDEVKGNTAEDDIRAFFGEFTDTELIALKQEARDRLYSDVDE